MKTWFAAARPFSFTASVVPVVVGTLLAAPERFSWWIALLAVAGSVLIHGGTNLVNDYYDHVKGADGPDSLGVGGAIQKGLLTPGQVLTGGVIAFAGGAAIGLILCAATSWELLYLGIASVLAGFLYTGAPVHLAYMGLGEATVFIFMGPVMVVGAYFVQVERWDWEPFVASLPIAFLVTAILQANNLRDIEHDREHGKRTVATMVGKTWAQREMYGLLGLTYVSLIVATVAGAIPWPGLIALVTIPLVRPIIDVVRTSTNPRKLNLALRDTAQLHMRFGMVLALGIGINWAWMTLR